VVVLGATLAGAGTWLLAASPVELLALTEGRGLDPGSVRRIARWLLGFGAAVAAILLLAWWKRRRHPGPAVVGVSAALWIVYGLGIMPALSPDSSGRNMMLRVGAHIGPGAELALMGWREQHLLQADRKAVEFGFLRPWNEQWPLAGAWLSASPESRWLFAQQDALGPCLDLEQVVDMGASNRRTWVLVPGTAWQPGCDGTSVTGAAE